MNVSSLVNGRSCEKTSGIETILSIRVRESIKKSGFVSKENNIHGLNKRKTINNYIL